MVYAQFTSGRGLHSYKFDSCGLIINELSDLWAHALPIIVLGSSRYFRLIIEWDSRSKVKSWRLRFKSRVNDRHSLWGKLLSSMIRLRMNVTTIPWSYTNVPSCIHKGLFACITLQAQRFKYHPKHIRPIIHGYLHAHKGLPGYYDPI